MGVKVSVFSRGWATVQGWVLGLMLGLGALLLACLPVQAQTSTLFSAKSAPASTSGTAALLASAAHVVTTEQVRAELLVHAPQGFQAGQTFWLGLQIEHQPDWHTYWQNPGDSGLPTRLQWQLPEGLQAGDIAWPLPKKFPIGTLANYGYEGRLLLTVPVKASADFRFPNNGPLAIQLHAEWLVCRQECIPQEGRFGLNLASAASQTPHAASFESAQRLSPKPMPQLQQGGTWITGGQTRVSDDGQQLSLRVHGLPHSWRGQALSAFPVTPSVVHNAAVQGKDWTQNWQGAVWSAQIPVSEERGDSPQSMRWVIAAGPESAPKAPAFEIETPVQGTWPGLSQAAPAEISPALAKALAENARAAQAPRPASQTTTALGLTLAILGALVGGLLLNLMPCVFPVLAIKVTTPRRWGGLYRGCGAVIHAAGGADAGLTGCRRTTGLGLSAAIATCGGRSGPLVHFAGPEPGGCF
jgi:thiol:disulfide interchange protein DsbD